jgi:hypothetical protein
VKIPRTKNANNTIPEVMAGVTKERLIRSSVFMAIVFEMNDFPEINFGINNKIMA